MYNLIKKLTAVFSVSGCEGHIAEIIKNEAQGFADEISTDKMGNLICLKKGKDSTKKVMVAAHMDEIGFVVTSIDDKGFIRVSNIGGIYPIYSSFQKVVFENGTKGIIIVDDKATEGTAKLKMRDMIIDIGAKSRKEAMKKVKVGDTCAVAPSLTRLMNNRLSAKAFDDRIGAAVALYSLKNISTPAYDTYFVFTVQEEVGLRGSKAAAFTIAPDYSIAIDVTRTGDEPGVPPMECKLDGGAAIKIKDSSVICSPKMVKALTKVAEDNKIKYQYEILEGGGTDTASMQTTGAGSFAGAISIPTRYIHSPVEMISLNDVMACTKLLTAFLENEIE